MSGLLEGKVVLITGCGAGLGKGLGKAMAREGAIVCGMARRADKIKAAAEEFAAISGDSLGMVGDVANREDVHKFVQAAVDKFGTVDVVVNNAMGMNRNLPEDITDEDLDLAFKSACYGSLYMAQEAFPYLKEHGGKIINFGSEAAMRGMEESASYSMAKAGCIALSRSLGLAWAKYNIQCNAIIPVAVSESWEQYVQMAPQETIDAVLGQIPAGRMGDPETDIAGIVIFLASNLSNYMTRRAIWADGGAFGEY